MKRQRSPSETKTTQLACVFCNLTEDCPEKYGEKKTYKEYDITLHYFCLLMSSGLYQKGEEDEGIHGFLIEDIKKEIIRSSKLKCKICKKNGASVGCSVKECRKTFHFPCGIQKECIFQYTDLFPSFCWVHRPVQPFSMPTNLSGTFACTICLEFILPVPSYGVLKCPCCSSSWFHRDCVQHQAYSAGRWFFRCTLCNNQDSFQEEMLRMGIHIPEKDASWELEENAYSDLLQAYERCDVLQCKCRRGREYSQMDSQWEIVRCQYCGSRGTHRRCSSLQSLQENWVCIECENIIHESGHSLHSLPTTPQQLISPKRLRLSPRFSRSILNRQLQFPRSAAEVLKELDQQIDKSATTLFSVDRRSVLDGALCTLRHKTFNPYAQIEVKFTDANCLFNNSNSNCREFLCLLMRDLEHSLLFQGSSLGKNLALDSQALHENLYYDAGRIIALSLVHGGPLPGFFSRLLFDCIVYGSEKAEPSLEDLSEDCISLKIKKINEAQTEEELQASVNAASEYLLIAGCSTKAWMLCDKDKLVQQLLNFHLILRIQMPLQRFCEGLKTLGVLEKVQMFPETFSNLFCQKPEKLTPLKLWDLFTVHFSANENENVKENSVFCFWVKYLQDCYASQCAASLEMILIFVTGADAIPPVGLNPTPSIEFVHNRHITRRAFPEADTHLNVLKLPVVKNYKTFIANMDYAICQTVSM
ncbi:G2/M phase-specific E3 ubiquitin-protein ligase [Erpetoichthys calabaricus]|uniref:G2/M-phase specific E3 ubiquitin protein ligase n=1 Tax=Erpetoichthys calabaricus TaxID=27687 RepID=A0A8C4T7T0_ERPCA|nr:G2/M phase-specific E3 ubiquitin-protein ligase [Erpetoichthys calabaricus]